VTLAGYAFGRTDRPLPTARPLAILPMPRPLALSRRRDATSSQRLQLPLAMLEVFPDPAMLLDGRGRLIGCNGRLHDLFDGDPNPEAFRDSLVALARDQLTAAPAPPASRPGPAAAGGHAAGGAARAPVPDRTVTLGALRVARYDLGGAGTRYALFTVVPGDPPARVVAAIGAAIGAAERTADGSA
jgi:hypothetical protein